MAENKVAIDSISGSFGTTVGTSVPGPNMGVGLQVATGTLLSNTTLNAVSTGTGTAVDLGSARANISAAITTSAGVSAGACRLEYSQDNTNWVVSRTPVTTNTATTVFQDTLTGGAWRYARVSVSTNITGGTVTATIMGS